MASGSDAAVGVRDDAHPTDPSHAAVHAPARGLWILAEGSYRVLDDPARIEPLLERATRLAATDLFVQVYRGGRAFYHAGPGIERAPGHEPGTPDTLGLLIEQAHARGLRVHAWVNVLSLSKRADAALIGDLGPEALLVDRFGRSLIDYPDFEVPEPDRRYYRMGTPGLYLDPGSLAVRERVVTTFRDLLERQSGLDGLHLDYIRHPDVLPLIPGSRFGVGLDFGYGAESRARYRAETGQPDPIEGAPPGVVRSATAWDDWRRDQVSRLVSEIAATSRATRPDIVVSAAVIAYVDRAYLTLAQDWRGWLEAGWLDLAMPMVYTLDDRLLRYQMESFAGWPLAARIWPGVGVWLFGGSPEGARMQLAILRRGRFAGEMLFSDDAIASSPELLAALVETPEGVTPPAPSTPSPSTPAP
ncbi:MAG: family 10 glycosylhydrolase [Myxococcota bacterium]